MFGVQLTTPVENMGRKSCDLQDAGNPPSTTSLQAKPGAQEHQRPGTAIWRWKRPGEYWRCLTSGRLVILKAFAPSSSQ